MGSRRGHSPALSPPLRPQYPFSRSSAARRPAFVLGPPRRARRSQRGVIDIAQRELQIPVTVGHAGRRRRYCVGRYVCAMKDTTNRNALAKCDGGKDASCHDGLVELLLQYSVAKTRRCQLLSLKQRLQCDLQQVCTYSVPSTIDERACRASLS